MICLPLEPVGVRPLAQRLAEGKVLDPAADQCRLALAAGSGGVQAAAEAVVRVQAAVPGLVRDREAVTICVLTAVREYLRSMFCCWIAAWLCRSGLTTSRRS